MTQNLIIYLEVNISYVYTMSTFLPPGGFKWIDSKGFDSNKYTSDSSNSSVLEVDLKYPEDLCELHNDYPLAPDKIEIIREMSKYQFKNWCLTFLLKESMCFILKTYNFTWG